MSDKIDLIIDTDPGVDDALAILLASAHPGVRLHALTVVHGNVPLEQTVSNACKILDVIGSDARVYRGCVGPLVCARTESATYVHGEDGLGDVDWPESTRHVEVEHAAAAIVRMANESPGRYTLAAIGPLTNVALALHLDPDLPNKLARFLIMGGAVTGRGNVQTGCAEFNIYTDPEAASLVFDRWPDFELVDWEATISHGFPIEQVDAWRELGDARADFYHQISGRVRAFVVGPREPGEMRAADALALSVVVDPGIVTRDARRYARVETSGASRGMTWVDWNDRLGRRPNCRVVLEVDLERFLALMGQGLGILTES